MSKVKNPGNIIVKIRQAAESAALEEVLLRAAQKILDANDRDNMSFTINAERQILLPDRLPGTTPGERYFVLVELTKQGKTHVTPGGYGAPAEQHAHMKVRKRMRKGVDYTSLDRHSGDETQTDSFAVNLTNSNWRSNWTTVSTEQVTLSILFVHRR